MRSTISSSRLLPFVVALTASCSGPVDGDGASQEADPASGDGTSSPMCGTDNMKEASVGSVQQLLVSPDVNTTPPFGRPTWGPHTPRSVKRLTWTIQKNYTDNGVWADGVGTRYSKRGSNEFILNELRKAFAAWASVADLEFQFVASGTADWQVRFMYQAPPQKWFDGLWSGSMVSINEHAPDFGSFGYEARAPGDLSPEPETPYRSAVHPGNGWLFDVATHEIGHGLGFAHAWFDNWDYHYSAIVNTGQPQPQKVCSDPGARCLYPYEKTDADFSIMDYRHGQYGGRHPRHRLLTAYDVDYSREMYGQNNLFPLIEIAVPDFHGPHYVTDWDTAGGYLDTYSYINHEFSVGGRESAAYMSNFVGAIRSWGSVTGTWVDLNYYWNPANGRTAIGTAANVPSGYQYWWNMGQVRTSSGGGFSTPLYRHYNQIDDIFKVTTSSTSPPDYMNQGLLGYMTGSPGTAIDSAVRPWDDSAVYQLTSVLTNKPVGTNTATTSNGTAVVNDASLRADGPRWRFINAGGGYYRLRDAESWRVLDVANASTSDGAKAQVWDYRGLPSQEWKIETSGSGYRFVARHTGKCLHLPNSSSKVQLTQQACNGSSNQQFKFMKRQQSFDNGGVYKIIARHSKKALDIAGASTADGADVQQRTSGNGNNQRWRISHDGTAWLLTAKHSGKLMEIEGASTANSAQAQQWGTTAQDHRRWRLNLNSEGYFQLVNHKSSKCLDIQGASQVDGAKAQQYTCGSGQNQQFDIVRVE